MTVDRVGRAIVAVAGCALLLGCPSTVVVTGDGVSAASSTSASSTSASSSSASSSGAGGAGGATVGAGGSNACAGHVYYAGMYPQAGGQLAPPVWAALPDAGGYTGLDAGNRQCEALGIGADHVCDLIEIQAAAAAHEPLLAAVPQGTTAWMQRTTPVYVEGLSGTPCTAAMAGQTDPDASDMCVGAQGAVPCVCALSLPGPGGDCNGWTYNGHYIGDGEFITFDQPGVPTYHFDNDTIFDTSDPLVHVHPGLDFSCAGELRAILCCYPPCM